jgi:hypothetical protein
MPEPRRIPAPWTATRTDGGYRITDAYGRCVAYVYARDDDWSAQVANTLTMDEARRVAAGITRLPELLGKRC